MRCFATVISRMVAPRTWFGCVVVLTVCLPVMFGAANPVSDREASRRQIEGMTESDRNRLKRNYQRFQKLSTAQQNQCRELNRVVEKDDDLKSLVKTYRIWLTTLSFEQRKRLRATSNPRERIKIVTKYKDQQFLESATLTQRDREAVMTVVQDKMKSSASGRMRNPAERIRWMISQRLDTDLLQIDFLDGWYTMMSQPVFRMRIMMPELTNEVIELVSAPRIRRILLATPPSERHWQTIMAMAVRGIEEQWNQEFQRFKPSDDEMQQFFLQLKSTEREQIIRMSPSKANRRLVFLYIEGHLDQFPPRFLPRYMRLQRLQSRIKTRGNGSFIGPRNSPQNGRRFGFGGQGAFEPRPRRGDGAGRRDK